MDTPKEIVKENFKGLNELIQDEDLLLFYKDLVETCLEDYAYEYAIEFGKYIQNREGARKTVQELYNEFINDAG